LEAHTLFELNEYIRRILALNLAEAVWIKCEIAQLDMAKGHCFLDLVEKDEQGTDIIARANAVIWQRSYRSLQRKLGRQLDSLLQEGMEVMLFARVDFNERYGLKLIIQDIDPAFTLGQFELQKRQTLERLQKENLLNRNRQHILPLVWQNIAVLSSQNAAGLQDFIHQIENNPYQYKINLQLFDATLQGNAAAASMAHALQKIALKKNKFDLVIIIRGGGAKLDLAPFNEYRLCRQIAELPLPLLTGIGHETDETIADLTAHTALKTPTAVADFILHHNLAFEGRIVELEQQLRWIVQAQLSRHQLRLQEAEEQLFLLVQQQFVRQQERLRAMENQLPALIKSNVKTHRLVLEQLEKIAELLNVENTLKRGYSLTTQEGKLIRSVDQLKEASEVNVRLSDGSFSSTVKKKKS
jgi:exodeoxyribonuclease VII large subunit